MRFVLDIELTSGAVRGALAADGAHPVEFSGWLELVRLIEHHAYDDERSTNS